MSIVNSNICCAKLPSLFTKTSLQYQGQSCLFRGKKFSPCLVSIRKYQKDEKSRRIFIVYNVVQPGGPTPPPSEPPFNFLNWVVGFFVTVVLPFVSHKWNSLLKIKGEVDTAVEKIEEIVDTLEKVADEVEKVAEDISEDLPEGSRLRKTVDFLEHVAEKASDDAHKLGDLIDTVQEVEDKVEEYAESSTEETNEAHKPPKETNNVTKNLVESNGNSQ